MALQKITFDGSSVTSKKDADINHHLGGLFQLLTDIALLFLKNLN